MERYCDRVEFRSLAEIKLLLEETNALYNKAKEVSDKIKLLELIGNLEEKIRAEDYKEKLLNGEE
jgi:hypothetical protein